MLRGTRPLKRWRYVAVFCEELYACAALVRIGPARQSFWALHERSGGPLRERTRLVPRASRLTLSGRGPLGEGTAAAGNGDGAPGGRLRIADGGVRLDLRLEEEAGFEATCRHGDASVWTRKQAGVRAHGTVSLDGAPARTVEALAVIDDTIGHHARRTEWWWSAGVGSAPDGVALAWNLVSGVNDPASGSERAVWVAGEPSEAAPVRFAGDLLEICSNDGGELRFEAEAERSRSENLLLVRSDYRAPFGTFSGTLPGGIALAHGLGVVEHHRARW